MQKPSRVVKALSVLAMAMLPISFPQASLACLAHYCSPDGLVAKSPLIVIARVEKVEKAKAQPRLQHTSLFSVRSKDEPGEPGPTIAHVKVLRVLKGAFTAETLAIGSGPIASCAPWAVHYGFSVGEERIFILPHLPEEGATALCFGGSVLPISSTEMIEQRIARAQQFQADYLAAIQRELPETYAAGQRLVERLQSESPRWPEPTKVPVKDMPDCFTLQEGPEFGTAMERLVKDLMAVDVEAIRTAMAMDWLREDTQRWSKHPLWERAIDELASQNTKNIAAAERARIRRELTKVGVAAAHVDKYLVAVTDQDFGRRLRFPPSVPYPYREYTPEDLTTGFILAFYNYDRGAMFQLYGMDFDALAKLDVARVKPLVAALYASDDARLRIVACRIIERVPGTAFVDLVLNDMDDNIHTWSHLVGKDDKDTEQRLTALLDSTQDGLSSWGRRVFWQNLRRGECYHDVCIRRAIDELEKIEAHLRDRPNDNKDETGDMRRLSQVLELYLAGAMEHRENKPLDRKSAAQYRHWFKAHPKQSDE
jgi:hypothetical protein